MTAPADFSTPERIIRYAMKDAGYLREGQDPTSEQFAEYSNRLNDLLNFWATQGLKLWTQEDLSITLVQGTQIYQLGPADTIITTRPMRVLPTGYYLDANSNRRPIYMLSREEWMRLSQVNQQGAVTQFFVDKQQLNMNVYFWLIPDAVMATGTAHLLIQQQVENFIELDETINLPREWFMAVRWGFAYEISIGQPSSVVLLCKNNADTYRKMVEDWDVEDADTRFSPDTQSRGSYANRGFL